MAGSSVGVLACTQIGRFSHLLDKKCHRIANFNTLRQVYDSWSRYKIFIINKLNNSRDLARNMLLLDQAARSDFC